jgi:hypothetical protein
VALKVVERGGEGVLDGVLGLLERSEHVPAETEEPGSVTLECDLEGGLVAAPNLLDERLVASQSQEALGAKGRERNPRWNE